MQYLCPMKRKIDMAQEVIVLLYLTRLTLIYNIMMESLISSISVNSKP